MSDSRSDARLSKPAKIESLFGLGPVSSGWLRDAGIDSPAKLRRIGAAKAYVRVLKTGVPANRNLLHGLHAAICDIHWTWLSREVKQQLDDEVAALLAPKRKAPRKSRGAR